ncbi:GGDEF domain-containing protein [Lichenicola sp.]|uniref:GGDEF domain-containing protein n=1 Tax=Lichenicola sp. TaxID=2804529 RepID=UPI003B0053DF
MTLLDVTGIGKPQLCDLLGMTGMGIWEWDVAENLVRLDRQSLVIAGWSAPFPQTPQGIVSRMHADDQPAALGIIQSVLSGTISTFSISPKILRDDGNWICITLRGQVTQRCPAGMPERLVGLTSEADEARWVLQHRSWPQDVESFLDNVEIAAWWYDVKSDTVVRSRHWDVMLGYSASEMQVGLKGWLDLVHPEDRSVVLATIRRNDRHGVESSQSEYRLRCRDGSYIWVVDRARIHVRTAEGTAAVLSGYLVDITAQVEARRALEALSSTDGLTAVANRRQFDAVAIEMWRTASRSGRPLCVLLIDVDFFKAFNDRYGHQAGDDCLQDIAGTMSRMLRGERDLLARYGGEEFAVLLPDCTLADALIVAERIRHAIHGRGIPHDARRSGPPVVTASIGVASSQANLLSSLEKLIGAADQALYDAKGQGRDRVCWSDAPSGGS